MRPSSRSGRPGPGTSTRPPAARARGPARRSADRHAGPSADPRPAVGRARAGGHGPPRDPVPSAEAGAATARAGTHAPGLALPRSTPPPPSLRRNALWALAGNLVYAASQAGILVALTKLTTAAEVGRFALGLAIAGPVVLFTNLHLRAVQATDARHAHAFGTYLGLRLVGVALALVVTAALALAADRDATTAAVIVAIALAKAVEALSDVLFGRLQQAEDLRRIALSLGAKGLASVGVVALVAAVTGSVFLAALALAGAWLAVLLLADLPAVRRLEPVRPRLAPAALGRLAWVALPLGAVMGLNALMVNVPRYAVEAALGPAALGHFAALAYVLVAANQPLLALGAAASPRLARHFVVDRRAYAALTLRTAACAVALGLAGVAAAELAGARILAVAYTPAYARHADLLVWLAVAAAVGALASAFGYAVTAARRFRQQMLVAGAALGLCALASWWLVPRYGLLGAAWALLAAESCRLGCLWLLYRGAARGGAAPGAGAWMAERARGGSRPFVSEARVPARRTR